MITILKALIIFALLPFILLYGLVVFVYGADAVLNTTSKFFNFIYKATGLYRLRFYNKKRD